MKVAHLTWSMSRRAGGMLDCTRRLAQELHGSGVDVEVFSPRDASSDADLPLWAALPVRLWDPVGARSFAYSPRLAEELQSGGFDIIHTHGLWTYVSAVSKRQRAGEPIPSMVSPQGMLDPWALSRSRLKKKLAWRLYEHRNLKGAACLHAVADAEVGAVRACGLRNPVCVIPNAVDLPEESTSQTAAPWATGGPSGVKALLFLGRIHPKKGLGPLLQAWATVGKEAKADSWRLVIVGWDQAGHEAELKSRTSDLGLQTSVTFAGPLFGDDREAAYRNADAFVLPSHGEGLPLAVLEAWSHKLPVVMTPQCNLEEGFKIGAAISAEPEAGSLAEALRNLFSIRDDERETMGQRGYDLVRQKFTWKKAAAEMKSVYNWVLGEGDRPACVITD